MVSLTGSTRAGSLRRQARGRHDQGGVAGAGRQVGQHHPRRRAAGRSRHGRRDGHDVQHRPELQRAVAHAGAGREAGGGRAHRRRRRCGGWWSATRRSTATTTGPIANRRQYERVQAMIAQGHRGGRDAGGRRPGPARRPGARLVRAADGVQRRRTTACASRSEEIFGPVLMMIPYDRRRRSHRDRQRLRLRPVRLRRGAARSRARPRVAKRLRTGMVASQRRRHRPGRAVRRLQALGQRARVGRRRHRRVPRDQGPDGRGRLTR